MKGFTLRVLLSNITALLLTVHTVFGCCCHHAHASMVGCEQKCPPGQEPISTLATYQICDGNHRSDGQEHHPANCTELSCVFVSSMSVKVFDANRSISPMVFLPMHQDCLAPAVANCEGHPLAAGRLPLPIHLNLVFMVLLI
jgi:hypothetical protein